LSVASQQGREIETRETFIVRSIYLATLSENIEALMFAIVICIVYSSVEML
jgi:hypothetical protein